MVANSDKPKDEPEHLEPIKDENLEVLVNEYLRLAKFYNIEFKNVVTIGFKDLSKKPSAPDGSVVGQCTRRWFREVDVDTGFWKDSTWTSKITLVYHELDHCYCDRDHDWGGKPEQVYKEAWIENLFKKIEYYTPMYKAPSGFFTDNCPMSIMNPWVMEDRCLNAHYAYYVKEMFERCDPW